MSRVITFAKAGPPEVLTFRDAPVPEPGPGEIRLRVRALGLNRAESMWRRGQYVETPSLPARIGYEASGTVEATGAGVENVAIGDDVSIVPGFSMNDYGMYGEQVLAPAAMAIKHPLSLGFEEAASIWMMFLTAYGALVDAAPPSKGGVVLIPAASSGVGLAAIQLVNMLGGVPVALTRTSAKRDRLSASGASHVIVAGEQDVAAEVDRITGGHGAEIVFDPIGGPAFTTLLGTLKVGGSYIVYGALSDQQTNLPILDVLARIPKIFGYTIWTTTSEPARMAKAVNFILKGLEDGKLKPIIDRIFDFEDIVAAHRHLEAGDLFGKIVVRL